MDQLVYTPDQLAKVLRGRRQFLGLTQRAAGQAVGLLPKTMSALESHPERSSVESLFKLLSALELELVLRPKGTEVREPSPGEW